MPNRFHNDRSGEPKSGPKKSGAGSRSSVWPGREGTANWPGLPGKAQPTDRGRGGDAKPTQHPKSEGI